MRVNIHNASRSGHTILTNDNIAGFVPDDTFYEADQVKTLEPRSSDDGYADLVTAIGSQRPTRHFPVSDGATIDVYSALTPEDLDLELRVIALRKRLDGLAVELGTEHWVDYRQDVTKIPNDRAYVATGWQFGDYHHDVAMWCKEITLVKPSVEQVAFSTLEPRIRQLLVSGAAPLEVLSNLDQLVLDLERDFSGLALNFGSSIWHSHLRIGDTPHKVENRNGVMLGVVIRPGQCFTVWAPLTMRVTRNQELPPGDGDLSSRVTALEARFESLRPILGEENAARWADDPPGRKGEVPSGSAMTGIQWDAFVYSRSIALRWG